MNIWPRAASPPPTSRWAGRSASPSILASSPSLRRACSPTMSASPRGAPIRRPPAERPPKRLPRPPLPKALCLRREHQTAGGLARFEIAMGKGRVGELVAGGRLYLHRALLDHCKQIRRGLVELFDAGDVMPKRR